jgi:hypothetical protein
VPPTRISPGQPGVAPLQQEYAAVMTDGPDRSDAEREALAALVGASSVPDEQILAAVQEGLESVVAGSPNAWFEVPRQRNPAQPKSLTTRRNDAR